MTGKRVAGYYKRHAHDTQHGDLNVLLLLLLLLVVQVGGYSLLLFGTNFVCIVLSALLLFRVKGVKRRRVDVSALVKQAEEKPRTEDDLNMSADNRSTFNDERDRDCTEEEEEEHGHLAVEGPGATSSGDVETITLTINPFNDDP
jgi:hypothetical protein